MTMTQIFNPPSSFLRRALLADAVLSGATGLLMIVGAGILGDLLALPATLLRAAGLLLVPYVAFVAFVGTREIISRSAVATIIVVNAVWAAASIGLLFTGWVAPNVLGYVFVAGQAVIVAALGELQYIALRR
jgi:hypothetical protein